MVKHVSKIDRGFGEKKFVAHISRTKLKCKLKTHFHFVAHLILILTIDYDFIKSRYS